MEGDRESSSFSSSSSSSSSAIKTWVLVLLVSIFLILLIPSFPSSIFRPGHVKKGWDTLNLALVVFAILCGLLGRDGGGELREEGEKILVTSSPVSEQRIYEVNQSVGIRLMRSSSSYDLTDWEISGDPGVKTIQVDIFELRKSPSKSPLPPTKTLSPTPPPPPPPPPIKGLFGEAPLRGSTTKCSQEFNLDKSDSHKTAAESNSQRAQFSQKHPKITPPLQPSIPPPPPPPPPRPIFPEQKKERHKKRKGAAAKDIATAIAQFYNKKKRRNKAKKIHDDHSVAFASPSTPPPPPPPPSFDFSHIFSTKKGGSKSKRSNSISDQQTSPPPPPPPPPPSFFPDHRFPPAKKKEKRPTFMNTYPIAPPSPLPPPPPPPPPPSFFPDHQFPPAKKKEKRPTFMNTYTIAPPSPLPPPPSPPPPPPTCIENGGVAKFAGWENASSFCPSPDVNNKADVFIKRFRHGLKLEKLREKELQDQPQEWLKETGIEMEMEQQILAMMMMGIDDNMN